MITLGLVACGAADDEPAATAPGSAHSSSPRAVALPYRVSAELPAGWHLLREPVTSVIQPVQVFAAASYPVELGKPSPGCHPGRLLDQRPPGGALVLVVEWSPAEHGPDLDEFPVRRRPFSLPSDAYASYECAGPSYNVSFRDRGRRFQAFVVLDRDRVDPRVRRQAIELQQHALRIALGSARRMKRLLLLLLVLPLAAVSSAEAKGIKWVKVCGPSGCDKTVERELDLAESPLVFPPWVMSGPADPPPKQAAPWLRVRVAYARSHRRVTSVVAPRIGYAGGTQGGSYGFIWQRLDHTERRTYKQLGRGLDRFPAATLPGLGEEASGPA